MLPSAGWAEVRRAKAPWQHGDVQLLKEQLEFSQLGGCPAQLWEMQHYINTFDSTGAVVPLP